MTDMFDQFKRQLIESDMGNLQVRQKMEFYPKVAAHAYHDELKKLASAYNQPHMERLVKKARMVRYGREVFGRDHKTPNDGGK